MNGQENTPLHEPETLFTGSTTAVPPWPSLAIVKDVGPY